MLARDFKNGERYFDLAGQLNPNDANITIARAQAAAYLGDAEKGLLLAKKAFRINPFHPDYYLEYLATIQFLAKRYAGAIATIELAPSVLPEISAWYASACAHLGRIEEGRLFATKFVTDLREKWAGPSDAEAADYIRWLLQNNPIRRANDIERLLTGLELAGLPKVESPVLETE